MDGSNDRRKEGKKEERDLREAGRGEEEKEEGRKLDPVCFSKSCDVLCLFLNSWKKIYLKHCFIIHETQISLCTVLLEQRNIPLFTCCLWLLRTICQS